MREYKLERPSLVELRRWAARLRRVDGLEGERRQAARAALPADWRTRDKLRAPEWPALGDLELWRDVGASHALELRLPAMLPTNPAPHAAAYCLGYTTILEGHMMPDNFPAEQPHLGVAEQAASELGMGHLTLGCFLSGDVSDLADEYQADVIVALHKMLGVNPLSKAWIVVDGKIYPTAAAASAVRRRHGLECDVMGSSVVEIGDVRLIKTIAECRDPSSGRSERSTSFVPWLVEHVTEWGENKNGKRFPEKKEWLDPTPDEVADKMMKGETKAMRRATLLFAALGSSAAEDVPGERTWITQVEDELAAIDQPHADEAGA